MILLLATAVGLAASTVHSTTVLQDSQGTVNETIILVAHYSYMRTRRLAPTTQNGFALSKDPCWYFSCRLISF